MALTAIASGALLLLITDDIRSAISTISAFPIPRVVMHGVPRRIPLVTAGGLSSYGMAFLFTVHVHLILPKMKKTLNGSQKRPEHHW